MPSVKPTSQTTRTLIYIVDDEPNIGEVVQEILQREGFDAVYFSNPLNALEELANSSRKPDMLLTDYVMQPINGIELMLKCRALQPGLKTLLFSGNVNGRITDQYNQRPNVFLEKPFQPKNLMQAVRNLLNMSPDGAFDG
jgi:DNA-binding NtrC family response regulator